MVSTTIRLRMSTANPFVRVATSASWHLPSSSDCSTQRCRMETETMFAVAGYGGCEWRLRALTWADIDFEGRVLHVRRSYVLGKLELPKSGRVRSVPLIPRPAAPLSALRLRAAVAAPGARVFLRADGGFIDDSAVRRRFDQAVAAAGLPRLRCQTSATVWALWPFELSLSLMSLPTWDTPTFRRR